MFISNILLAFALSHSAHSAHSAEEVDDNYDLNVSSVQFWHSDNNSDSYLTTTSPINKDSTTQQSTISDTITTTSDTITTTSTATTINSNPTDAVPDTTTTILLNLNSSANESFERDTSSQTASPALIGSIIAVVCSVFAIGGVIIYKRRRQNRDDIDYAGIEEGSSVGSDNLESAIYLEPVPTLQIYHEVLSNNVIREKSNPIYNHAQPFKENSYPGIEATYSEVHKMPVYESATQEGENPESTYEMANSEVDVAHYDVGDSMPHYEVASK